MIIATVAADDVSTSCCATCVEPCGSSLGTDEPEKDWLGPLALSLSRHLWIFI
jgi:hypothetical protein